VSVFALPIYASAGKTSVLTSPPEIANAGKSVIGLPTESTARRMALPRDALLQVSKQAPREAKFSPEAISAFKNP
jgi:hypothetical protein